MARVAKDQVAEFERALLVEPRNAPCDAQRHDLPRWRPAEPRPQHVDGQRVIAVLDVDARPRRLVIAANVIGRRMDPVEQQAPLNPVTRVDNIEPVGRLLRHD